MTGSEVAFGCEAGLATGYGPTAAVAERVLRAVRVLGHCCGTRITGLTPERFRYVEAKVGRSTGEFRCRAPLVVSRACDTCVIITGRLAKADEEGLATGIESRANFSVAASANFTGGLTHRTNRLAGAVHADVVCGTGSFRVGCQRATGKTRSYRIVTERFADTLKWVLPVGDALFFFSTSRVIDEGLAAFDALTDVKGECSLRQGNRVVVAELVLTGAGFDVVLAAGWCFTDFIRTTEKLHFALEQSNTRLTFFGRTR